VASIKDLSLVWDNIKEVDLKPIRDSATHAVRIVLIGEPGVGRHALAEQMRTDPARPGMKTQTSVAILTMDMASEIPPAHLTIIVVDGSRSKSSAEQDLVKRLNEAGRNVLVFINNVDMVENTANAGDGVGWMSNRVIHGSTNDSHSLQREFVPTILEMLPQQHLALGRQFPLFRLPIAHQLINDTCFSNAAYSFSTGLAEIVPVLGIPLNLTDMIILTKSQAFLAYRLGLLFGFTTRWQDYITEFGGVIGSGFVWRQIARQLVGLIPVWGIIPKVAIAYSGTYVVGNAILGWYLTGRHLDSKQMKALSAQAVGKGKDFAQRLATRLPRRKQGKKMKGKLPAPQKTPALSTGEIIIIPENAASEKSSTGLSGEQVLLSEDGQIIEVKTETTSHREMKRKRFQLKRKKPGIQKAGMAGDLVEQRTCTRCGKNSSADASFCQYCGYTLGKENGSPQV
jgi:uncharacterized protein (DUF697 family)/ribosomal protein L37E